MSDNVFEVDHLGLYYLGRFGDKTHAVTDVSFSMKQGEILGIAGESGCGKSTLVYARFWSHGHVHPAALPGNG